jgi:malate dehydrogenase
MIESILHDRHRVVPCSVYLEGEYGVQGAFSGVPIRIGSSGLEAVVELPLSLSEKTAFEASVTAIREGVASLHRHFPDKL